MARNLRDLPRGELGVDLLGELAALLRQALDLLRDVHRGVVLHETQLLDLLLELRNGLLEFQEARLHGPKSYQRKRSFLRRQESRDLKRERSFLRRQESRDLSGAPH